MSGYILYTEGLITNRLKIEDFGNCLYFHLTEDWDSASKFVDIDSVKDLRDILTKWIDDFERKEGEKASQG